MSGIEGLKEKIRKVSEVAFQEKSFKQSGGMPPLWNTSFLEVTNPSLAEMKDLVSDIQNAQSQMIIETRERDHYLKELLTEIARSNKPPTRLGEPLKI